MVLHGANFHVWAKGHSPNKPTIIVSTNNRLVIASYPSTNTSLLIMAEPTRLEIELSVDYGYTWPMSTIFWDDEPDWQSLLPKKLYQDLQAWARFFNEHADHETGLFGSEELRRHFDLEGFRLRDELEKAVGDHYRFTLGLWF